VPRGFLVDESVQHFERGVVRVFGHNYANGFNAPLALLRSFMPGARRTGASLSVFPAALKRGENEQYPVACHASLFINRVLNPFSILPIPVRLRTCVCPERSERVSPCTQ
jgi:hypothetical protein